MLQTLPYIMIITWLTLCNIVPNIIIPWYVAGLSLPVGIIEVRGPISTSMKHRKFSFGIYIEILNMAI